MDNEYELNQPIDEKIFHLVGWGKSASISSIATYEKKPHGHCDP